MNEELMHSKNSLCVCMVIGGEILWERETFAFLVILFIAFMFKDLICSLLVG